MGSSYFQNYAEGTNARDLFDALVRNARHQYGNGGYTGSIAEKNSFAMRKTPKPLTMKEAGLFAATDGENADKYDSAFAIPVYTADTPPKQVGVLFYGWARD